MWGLGPIHNHTSWNHPIITKTKGEMVMLGEQKNHLFYIFIYINNKKINKKEEESSGQDTS